jgi:hypothetical protein
MSLAIPLTNGHMQAGAQQFAGSAPVVAPQPTANASEVQGTGRLTAPHNTPMHVAGIVLFAGAVVLGLHFMGFRLAFDVGLGRG